MSIILGTNSGFVTVAPTTDPAGSNQQIDESSFSSKDTSPAIATKITEIGWYCDNATQESNFEVGLYAADGAVVPGEAGTRLYVSATNAKGTTSGWKRVTVDWDISGNTAYWLGLQLDNTTTTTDANYNISGGAGFDINGLVTTNLPDPFGGGSLSASSGMVALYAVYYTPPNRFWVGGTGNWDASDTTHWALTSGGAGGFPVPTTADDVTFDLHSNEATDAAYTCTLYTALCKNLDVSFTGTTKVTIAGIYGIYTYGNLNLSGGTAQVIWSSIGSSYFYDNSIITTNGVTLNGSIFVFGTSKTLTLGSNLTTSGSIHLSYPGDILDVSASNYTITAGAIIFNYSTQTLTLGSGTHTLTGSGTVFNNSAGATITASTGTIKIINTTNSNTSFVGGGKTYNNIWFSRGASTAINTITGSNTFAELKDTGTEAHSIQFQDGTDQTITSLTVNGSAGKLITLTGTSSAGWRISDTTGTNTVTYCNISYSTAEGGATWRALLDTNTNGGNNTGWTFYDPFTNPGNIYSSNNVYATLAATSGILTVEISKDAGVNWLVAKTVTFTASDTLQTCGTGSTELWGSSFTRADMVDAKLRIRLTHGGYRQVYKTFGFATGTDILTGIEVAIEGKYGSPTMSLDLLEVKIYYGTSTLAVQAGSQAFDSTNGTLAVYNGANWVDIGAPPDLSGYAPKASPTFTGTVVLPSTTSIGTVSATEIGYVDGVTSAIQTQLGTKAPLASPTFTGTPSLPTGTIATTQAANDNSTKLATTAYVEPYANNSLYRQAIINGNFDVWQRGTSFNTNNSFLADRWLIQLGGSSTTVTRQIHTLGQTNVPNNPKYYERNVVTSSAGAGNYVILNYNGVEGVNNLSGKTFTLSFYAKADASKNIAIEFSQNFGTGGSPSTLVSIPAGLVALTTSWAKYTVTVAIPSISGKTLGTDGNDYTAITFWLDAGSSYNTRASSLGQQSGTFEFSQVQLNAGSVALPFMPKSYAEELRDCQRYYYKIISTDNDYAHFGSGFNASTTASIIVITFPIQLRIAPTLETSTVSNFYVCDAGITVTAIAIDTAGKQVTSINCTVASGLTSKGGSRLLASGIATAYIAFNAEL